MPLSVDTHLPDKSPEALQWQLPVEVGEVEVAVGVMMQSPALLVRTVAVGIDRRRAKAAILYLAYSALGSAYKHQAKGCLFLPREAD